MKREFVLFYSIFCSFFSLFAQWIPINELPDTLSRDLRHREYVELQRNLCRGWNTWYNNSVLSHVFLPGGFSINLCFSEWNNRNFLRESFKSSPFLGREEQVDLGMRTLDGGYTSLTLTWKDVRVKVESTVDGDDQLILVTPLKASKDYLIVEAGLLWGLPGSVGKSGECLQGKVPGYDIMVRSSRRSIPASYLSSSLPRLSFHLDSPVGIYTGHKRSLSEIIECMNTARKGLEKSSCRFGQLSEAYLAMQSILAWNTIYDAPNSRVITPVSRLWNEEQGGWVLYEWDTNFASLMFSLFSREYAYANSIEIIKGLTEKGFVPGRISVNRGRTNDRSQPPLGSMTVWHIYNRYKEKWYLEECYNELLSWNRWWVNSRSKGRYLCWGYDGVDSTRVRWYENARWLAICESGLDNTHMYDDIPFDVRNHTLDIADVGLLSMYIMDCKYLSKIALELGFSDDSSELLSRASYYTNVLQELWDEDSGLFLNLRLDTLQFSRRISPTNFYPLLAGACSQRQAERMVSEHYFNPKEFYGEYVIPSVPRNDPAYKDNDYWRGRIWGPMNFLVYLGLCNYDLSAARKDLVEKSYSLLMNQWSKGGSIYENYNALTGEGSDVKNADGFYHWGALLGFIAFCENDLFNIMTVGNIY